METKTITIPKTQIVPVPYLSESEVRQKYPNAIATMKSGDRVIQVIIPQLNN